MKKESEVKKFGKKIKVFTYTYNSIKLGIPPSHINNFGIEENSICSNLNMTKQSLEYYLSAMKKLGWIIRKNKVWSIVKELSEEEIISQLKKSSKNFFSRGMSINKPITNLHALEIKFPILEGKIEDSEWEIRNKLNNWLPKYKGLDILGGLTIRNNNNKSITIFAKARNIDSLEEVDNLAFKIRAFIYDFFKQKHGVILDVLNCETKNINLATEDKKSEGMLRKGEKFELRFNKKAGKIFKEDKIDSKAWLDGSPFKFTAETNDKDWKRAYLTMPFAVNSLIMSLPALNEYNRNLKLHIKVQKEQLKTQKEIQKLLKKLDKSE